MKFIHYGHTSFEPLSFKEPKNVEYRNKPTGGLWASPVGAAFGWREWNDRELFCECNENNSFTFSLADNANILTIKSMEDVEKLPLQENSEQFIKFFDFEKMVSDKIDAILFLVSECRELYMTMYGWDCDCILILNKNIIKEKSNE